MLLFARLERQRDARGFAAFFVFDLQFSEICAPELFARIQQFEAVHGAVRPHVHEQIVREPFGLDRVRSVLEMDVCDVQYSIDADAYDNPLVSDSG